MKKIFLTLLVSILTITSVFADRNNFYENGTVIDTMYVNSEEGLKVRGYPSLKSNRLCGLPHRLPVKIIAVGKEETIDEITAPWVEILIPSYEWKDDKAEYGWVFGAYLSHFQPEFIKPKAANQLKEYLKCGNWSLPDKNTYSGEGYREDNHFNFYTKYTYTYSRSRNLDLKAKEIVDSDKAWFFQNYDDDDNQSTWKVLNNHQVEIHWYIPKSIDEIEILEIVPIDESQCYINGKRYLNKPFVHRHHWHYSDVVKMPLIYKTAYSDDNLPVNIIKGVSTSFFSYWKETQSLFELRDRLISKLITYGISAKNTQYEQEYRNYWDPIMEEHQKKADSILD